MARLPIAALLLVGLGQAAHAADGCTKISTIFSNLL